MMNPSQRLLILCLLALGVAPLLLPEFYVTLLCYIGLATLVVLGLVVMTGVAGIVSFGQQAFVGAAAYATAGLTTLLGWSPWGSLAASILLVAAMAVLIGAVTLRLSGHYLSIATIASVWSITSMPPEGRRTSRRNADSIWLSIWKRVKSGILSTIHWWKMKSTAMGT